MLLLGLVATGQSQPFGRFGYTERHLLPSFEVDATGFRARHSTASPFGFESAGKSWKPLLTSEFGQTVQLAGIGRGPLKLNSDLLSLGFGLYFQNGFGFVLATERPPFLSWAAGSVGPGVPTPESSWVLVSFESPQPPILLAFDGEPASVKVTGRPGQWLVRSEKMSALWVRVSAPFGVEPRATSTAAELGAAVRRVTEFEPFWTRRTPRHLRVAVEEEPTALTATWTFSGPGAALPQALLLATNAGYGLRIESEFSRIDAPTAEGPTALLDGKELRVRFPIRRVPTGRAVGVGPAPETISTASWLDVPSVVELALANMISCREAALRQEGDRILSEYFAQTQYLEEPATRQKLPFAPNGAGMDVAAAHSLLMQALENSRRASSSGNSLLTSLAWRRDWSSWRLWGPEPVVGRRAAALASITAALCPEPERRLHGALFQAGLAAERAYHTWSGVKGALIEPLAELRRALFAGGKDAFGALL
ncbi:MAG TPA: hypothetical protein VM328_11685, partial [Fimbriimonadaceae bacterium]|nr:hypothetical protein [Fimbriimonadaceae bacterium]